MRYTRKMVDPYKNIAYGSTKEEEFTIFAYEENIEYPIQVEMVGVTNPDKDYFIARKVPHYFVIEYVVSGKGYVEVNGETYEVNKGDLYILKPGITHKYWADKTEPYCKIWINCFSGFLNEFLIVYGLANRVVFNGEGCKKYFDELLEFAKEKPYNEDYSVGVSKILFSLFFALCERNNSQSGVSTTALKTKQALDSSVYHNVTIEGIAKQISVSKSQMTREFKKYYKQAPYQYLLAKKINVAKQYLLGTKMKIGEISNMLCFSDEYNFSNFFKKKVGVYPKEFREKEGKG